MDFGKKRKLSLALSDKLVTKNRCRLVREIKKFAMNGFFDANVLTAVSPQYVASS